MAGNYARGGRSASNGKLNQSMIFAEASSGGYRYDQCLSRLTFEAFIGVRVLSSSHRSNQPQAGVSTVTFVWPSPQTVPYQCKCKPLVKGFGAPHILAPEQVHCKVLPPDSSSCIPP